MATSKIEYNGWKLQGTATGGNAIPLPTSYSELFVVTAMSRTRVTNVIPKDIVGNGLWYYGGQTTTNAFTAKMTIFYV